jgi:hypothetical protein
MSEKEHWKSTPDEHDYPAAHDYLTLVIPEVQVNELVKGLMNAPLATRQAKDLLRAAGLPVLPDTNVHVANDLAKINKGEQLSPVLLVRGEASRGAPLVVADGYHRICASYHLDEDADIPCRLVDRPAHGQ